MQLLFNLLFKKQLEASRQVVRKAKMEAYKARQEANLIAAQYELIGKAFNEFPNGKMLGIEENKKGESVFVFEHLLPEKSLTLYLYGMSYQKLLRNLPKIECTVSSNLPMQAPEKHFHIEDIPEIDYNIGNGSILMSYLIRRAKEQGAKYISGMLSDDDRDHFDRLEHFYHKHGFEVSFNQDRTSGNIKLVL